jgi:glutamyl-tRNA reductase
MINIMSHRLVKKVLHRPIVNLKCMATNGDSARYTSAARQLFGLSEVLKETDSAVAQSLDCV